MIKARLKRYLTSGLRASLRRVLFEFRLFRSHRSGIAKARAFQGRSDLKLHLGCGVKLKPGWVNIDALRPEADINLDLRESLPFPDRCASMVYSEHFLEHIDYPEPASSLLRECYRVLDDGGVFSIGLPDSESAVFEFAGVKDFGFFGPLAEKWHADWCTTRMEHLNYHFRQDHEHQFCYDFETLDKALGGAGFVEVHRRDFDSALDSEERREGTFYVDARKRG